MGCHSSRARYNCTVLRDFARRGNRAAAKTTTERISRAFEHRANANDKN